MHINFSFFKRLVTSGTRVSSTRFNLVYIGIMVIILLSIIGFVLIYDVITDGVITTDLNGVASIIGALTGLMVAVGLTKVGDTYGKGKYNNHTKGIVENIEDTLK